MKNRIIYSAVLVCIIAFKGCTTKKNFASLISQNITSQFEYHYKDDNSIYFPSNFVLNADSLLKLNPNFNKDTVSVIINKYDDGGRECYMICNRTDTIVYCQGKRKPSKMIWYNELNCSCPEKNFFNQKRKERIEKFDTSSTDSLIIDHKEKLLNEDEEVCGGLHTFIIRIIFTQKKYKLDYMYLPNYIDL